MLISREEFKKKYKELCLAKTPYIATLVYWKMKYLIESFLIEQNAFYRKCYTNSRMATDKKGENENRRMELRR